MKLIEIKGLFEMDTGAPSPMIISNDSELFVAFYANKERTSAIPKERNIRYDTGIFVMKFKGYLKFTLGLPGEETISGHPYRRLGMKSYSFYELKKSDLIKSLQKIEKVHPRYNSENWNMYKHYIITFHDNMFECVAQDFEIREENESIHNQGAILLNELFAKYL